MNTLTSARAAIVFAAVTLVALVALHLFSPEFNPSWRMVSEYARGNYSWMLSVMFGSWALSTWMLALAVLPYIKKSGGVTGLVFLALAGLGEAMATVFNIDHPLHDLAGGIGVLALPIAALLISRRLRDQHKNLEGNGFFRIANLPWISLVIFIGSMIIMYVQFTKAGGQINAHVTQLPKGVTGLNGWANRLMILVYCAWAINTAWVISHLNTKETRYETATV